MNTLKHRGGSRIALFVAGVVIALFGAVAGGVGTVSAHHVELEASVDCSYVVYWTASSWNPGDLYGENNQIDVSYQVEGAGPSLPLASGAFTPGSNSFSGSFTFPSGASHVVITSVAVGLWGGTVWPGGPDTVTVYNPGECETTTTAGNTTTTAANTTTTAANTTTTAANTTTTAANTTTTAANTTTTAANTTTTAANTTTTAANTTTTAANTTTTAANTTTTAANTTTTAGNTTTTAGNTTTTAGNNTTTTAGNTTTTAGATTTSEVASEAPTTTQFDSETPTTTTVRSLPPTGSRSGSMQLVALGLLLIGLSLVLTARRRIA
ncbi:MAG TPA: hypothetical protein PLT40_05955 [Ilumatobacteraceae bacterium]|nr:hypothetical protein [Ilumatobacteraceae bacterium]